MPKLLDAETLKVDRQRDKATELRPVPKRKISAGMSGGSNFWCDALSATNTSRHSAISTASIRLCCLELACLQV
jgi:hypothetical protein